MPTSLSRSLAALFRSKADTTSLKKLAREGFRTVNVLGFEQLETIVGEAIERALAEAIADGSSPSAFVQGAQVEFLKLVGNGGRLAAKRDEFERGKAELEGNLQQLESTLAQQQQQLADRSRAAAAADFARLKGDLDAALAETFGRSGGALAPELRAPLRDALLTLLSKAARNGSSEMPAAASVPSAAVAVDQDEVDRLKRRIERLKGQLEETQQLLARARDEKPDDAGIASIHKTVQGIADAKDARRGLLRDIFEHNLALRRSLQSGSPVNDRKEGSST